MKLLTERGNNMNSLTVQEINQLASIDLSGAMQSWVRFIEGSPKTVETYTRAVRQFYKWATANNITQPTKEDIRSFRDEMKASRKPTTAQNYLMALRQFFAWTEETGLYPNIARNVKGVKLDNTDHKRDELTTAQAKSLLSCIDRSTARGKRDYAIISLMLTTGMRTIEIVRANKEDLRTIEVQNPNAEGSQKTEDFPALYYQGKGKEDRAQFKKIPPQVDIALQEYLSTRGSLKGEEPLFISTAHRNTGERLTTRSISRIVKDRLREAGLDSPRLTAHSLRHTCATQNLLNGGSLEETQQLLNHSNISTTMVYSHHLNKAQRQAEQRIATAILG